MSINFYFKKIINPSITNISNSNNEKKIYNKTKKIYKNILKKEDFNIKNKNNLSPDIFLNIDEKKFIKIKNTIVLGLENYLVFVSQLYFNKYIDIKKLVVNYKNKSNKISKKTDNIISSSNHEISNKNNSNNMEILDKINCYYEFWTPKEIAIFECCICKFGKDYTIMAELIKTKTIKDIKEFFELWKFTTHYMVWSQYDNKFLNIWI